MKNFGRNPILSIGSVLLAALWLFAADAQAASGVAEVKKVVGIANFTDAKGGGPIKEGDILMEGATITTGAGSYVDLDLKVNGNALRVEADSTLALNKLDYVKAGDTIINTQLEVKKGSTVANVVNKLSKASKYEIKTASGVAGIRGTVLKVTTTRVTCLIGKVEFRTVNGQLQLVIGGTVYSSGAAGPVKATTVETTGLATAATSCTANTQASTTVNQVVKQFTTVIAAEAAADAGPGGAAQASADAARAVLAALVAAVKEAADNAPPAIRAAAQAAAADLAKRSEAIQTASAADGAALGTIASGGTSEQAKANGDSAADRSTTNKDISGNAKKNIDKVVGDANKIKQTGGSGDQIIAGTVDGGAAGLPVNPNGSPTAVVTNDGTKKTDTVNSPVGETKSFISSTTGGGDNTPAPNP